MQKLIDIKESTLSLTDPIAKNLLDEVLLVCETLQLKNQNLQVELDHVTSELDCVKKTLGASTEMSTDKKARTLCAELEDVRVTRDALLSFTTKILSLPPGLVDVDQIQETAVDSGVLIPFEASEPCGFDCRCAKTGFPSHCLALRA